MPSILDSLLVAPPTINVDEARTVADKFFNVQGEIRELGGERDRNFLITSPSEQVLLKIANAAEEDSILSMQCEAIQHIQRHAPGLPVPQLRQTREQHQWAVFEAASDHSLRARAFNYLPGKPIGQAADNNALMHNLGQSVAQLNLALRSFTHPAAQHPLAWNTQCLDQLEDLLHHVTVPEERELAEKILSNFKQRVKPQLHLLRHQVIHNDICFHNTIVGLNTPTEITGIFDFGDMVFGPIVQDLANPAAEVPAGSVDPLSHSARMIAGFHSITPLEDLEITLLPDFIAGRLALCLILEAWADSTTEWQDDREHLDGWHDKCVDMMRQLDQSPQGAFEQEIRRACGLPQSQPAVTANTPADLETAWAKRQQFIGNANYYAYDKPLHMVRGEGVWLFDAEGDRYLDAYNNVPHAGHCHPAISATIARQTAILNTNTRYHYDVVTEYAERITSTLPDGLDTCYFVSSGSEANDLAWRLATNWSGNTGALVLDHAYHGVTEATYALSPAESKPSGREFLHIGLFAAPDDYRGPWKRDEVDRGTHYAGYVSTAIADLASRGHQPAALYLDMIMSSNGVFTAPPGYLETLYPLVHASGGLCIADEVQSGFGRTGKHMWGFEFGDATPDMVTFGKPIAGGYPMGLVVTRKEIAESFESQGDFFSTTGGNPVACAAALAMLQVIEDENLMDNANQMGEQLSNGIRSLANDYPVIGDVRGSGLFIGVEIVHGDGTMTPAADKANSIVNGLRHNNILIGSDGNYHNVLKVRPPMVFNKSNVDFFLEKLEHVLASMTDEAS